MPTRYIGRAPHQFTKSLYEICRQLKDFGVGRIVYQKNLSERFPTQKSYYKLTKVVPEMTCPTFHRGSAWGLEVFRGKEKGESQITTGYKFDWILVPKEEEQEFCKVTDVHDVSKIALPTHVSCPPLLEIILKRELLARGEKVPTKIEIPFIADRYIEELDSEYA